MRGSQKFRKRRGGNWELVFEDELHGIDFLLKGYCADRFADCLEEESGNCLNALLCMGHYYEMSAVNSYICIVGNGNYLIVNSVNAEGYSFAS